jgi:hypothetical protein
VTAYETLCLMRDIPGVAGSCLLDRDARVLVRDLPVDIGDDLLTAVGRRVDAVLRAVGQPLPSASGVVLRFARLSVTCSRVGKNVLILLCAPETSAASVKTAIQVSASGLAKVVEPVPASPPANTPDSHRERGSGIWG